MCPSYSSASSASFTQSCKSSYQFHSKFRFWAAPITFNKAAHLVWANDVLSRTCPIVHQSLRSSLINLNWEFSTFFYFGRMAIISDLIDNVCRTCAAFNQVIYQRRVDPTFTLRTHILATIAALPTRSHSFHSAGIYQRILSNLDYVHRSVSGLFQSFVNQLW